MVGRVGRWMSWMEALLVWFEWRTWVSVTSGEFLTGRFAHSSRVNWDEDCFSSSPTEWAVSVSEEGRKGRDGSKSSEI